MTMSDILLIIILVLFMAVVQFIAMLMVRRFDRFCNKIKSKFLAFHHAPERKLEGQEKKKASSVIMDDISSDVPPLDDI
jgi:flagellar basal body-associated protein FliL